MTKNYLKASLIAAASLCATETIAQINMNNFFETISDGPWDSNYTWRKWRNASNGWISPNGSGPGRGTPRASVFNNMRFTTRIEGANYHDMDKTIIFAGASVKSNASLDDTVRLVRMYAYHWQNMGPDTSLCVLDDGTFGGVGKDSWIVLESDQGNKIATDPLSRKTNRICGNGTIAIAGIRMGSVAGGFTDSLIIDANISINGNNNVGSAYGYTNYMNSSANHQRDSALFYITQGRTVTLIDSAFFHMRSNTTENKSGYLFYSIDGTLDASQSVGRTNVIASPVTPTSITDIEVNGLFKMGMYFNTMSASADSGQLIMNINNGGVVNATAVATPNANFAAKQWFTNGTGVMKRYVGATDTAFAVKYRGASNNTLMLKAATADTFSVAAKAPSYFFPGGTALVEWQIAKAGTGNADVTASFMWTDADGMSPASTASVSAYVLAGGTWKEYPATLSGTGTVADPYKAVTNSAITTAGIAYVGYAGQTLPPFPVGIKGVTAKAGAVSVAPNPVINGQVSVKMDGVAAGKYELSLYSITGQRVFQTTINHTTGSHNLNLPSTLTSGIYQLSVNGDGFRAVEKVVVQ